MTYLYFPLLTALDCKNFGRWGCRWQYLWSYCTTILSWLWVSWTGKLNINLSLFLTEMSHLSWSRILLLNTTTAFPQAHDYLLCVSQSTALSYQFQFRDFFFIVMLLHEMHLNCFIRELFPALMRTFGHETSLITLTMMIMKMLIMKLLQLLLTTWGQSLFASHSSQSE